MDRTNRQVLLAGPLPTACRRPQLHIRIQLQAAEDAFPRWVRAQTYLRNTVVFVGSAVVLIAVSLA